MKILFVHNFYQYSGGEDVVFKNEFDLLKSNRHQIIQYFKNNIEIQNYSLNQKIKLFFESSFSNQTFNEIRDIIKTEIPNICHVHNYMPLISPSVLYACNEMNVPVIQTLHNYRMLCAKAYLFRNSKICEECVGKSLYHGVKYGCYRNSRIKTFAVAKMIESNKRKGTWDEGVDAYIALTSFSKNKFVEGGMPGDKIFVKPNFLFDDPGYS